MIRSIPTTYKGVRFASTLEADWAKTLDALRIRWEYEPEGVRLPDGQNYRCDMYLPHLRTWLEVKGPHDQRLDKPAALASALVHAPGCSDGDPAEVFARPQTSPAAVCPCGHGEDFPYNNVVIGRPAASGKLSFEPVHGPAGAGVLMVLLTCPVCAQRSFIDHHGAPICRRCKRDATGGSAYLSGRLPFHRVEPPRGRRRGSRRTAKAAS